MPFESLSTHPRPSNRTRRHQAVCATCDTSYNRPLQPSPDRPVYCPPCFKAHRNGLSPAVNAPVSESCVANHIPADSAHDDVAVFPGMALNRATRAALSKMDISAPTPIQEQSIPHLLAGQDLIGQARTGSGKTLGVCRAPGRAMRPIDSAGPGACAGAHPRVGHSGLRSHERPWLHHSGCA